MTKEIALDRKARKKSTRTVDERTARQADRHETLLAGGRTGMYEKLCGQVQCHGGRCTDLEAGVQPRRRV